MANNLLAIPPPRIAMSLLAIAALLHVVTPLGDLALPRAVGLALAFAGTGFTMMMWAWWQFRQHRVAICPTEDTERLITTGVYRLTRNPMYLGIVMMLAGASALFGSLPFLAATAAFFAVMQFAFCPYEERKLVAAFGDDYRRYAAGVSRWI